MAPLLLALTALLGPSERAQFFKLFPEGKLQATGRCLDIAIDGPGFFEVTISNGEPRYTRRGDFCLNDSGNLMTREGYLLAPPLTLPPDTLSVDICVDGTIMVLLPDKAESVGVGQIALHTFPNPLSLQKDWKDYFRESGSSGAVRQAMPGSLGVGLLRQGFLEKLPNVQLDTEPPRHFKLFPEGKLHPTHRCLDLAINGPGFFAVTTATGQTLYTRRGDFQLNAGGQLVTREGYELVPRITLPDVAVSVAIAEDGTIEMQSNLCRVETSLGQLELSSFSNPLGLQRVSKDYYAETRDSGNPWRDNPGNSGRGRLRQGYLEELPPIRLNSEGK